MYLYYKSYRVKHYTLSSRMCLYWYFLNFLWSSHQSVCWADTASASSTEERGITSVGSGPSVFSWRSYDKQSVTWWKWKNLLQEIHFFSATCFCSRAEFCLGTEQCCFWLFWSVVLQVKRKFIAVWCQITHHVSRLSVSKESPTNNTLLSQVKVK